MKRQRKVNIIFRKSKVLTLFLWKNDEQEREGDPKIPWIQRDVSPDVIHFGSALKYLQWVVLSLKNKENTKKMHERIEMFLMSYA